MRIQISFDPNENLIYLRCKIYGPDGHRFAKLALDTGAMATLISIEIIHALGYETDFDKKARIIMGGGEEYASLVEINKIRVANQQIENLTVTCFNLPQETGLDGLLGLNFLRHFDTEINYSNSTLVLKPIG
ncbi:MAG: aspartyl protease family protein [bacterium]